MINLNQKLQQFNMTFVNGLIYGSGFTVGAIFIVVLSQKLFGVGICG